MPKNAVPPPLRYYSESWWKVEGDSIYYLAGRSAFQPELAVGWYWSDETQGLNGPYESREEAERMLARYCKECL